MSRDVPGQEPEDQRRELHRLFRQFDAPTDALVIEKMVDADWSLVGHLHNVYYTRKLSSWGIAASILLALIVLDLSHVGGVLAIVVCGLLIAVRWNLLKAQHDLRRVINGLRVWGSNTMHAPGSVMCLQNRAFSDISGDILMAEIISDDGGAGSARILGVPIDGRARVIAGMDEFYVTRDDVVVFHRKEEITRGNDVPFIAHKLESAPTPSAT